jgi:hypothetical protein
LQTIDIWEKSPFHPEQCMCDSGLHWEDRMASICHPLPEFPITWLTYDWEHLVFIYIYIMCIYMYIIIYNKYIYMYNIIWDRAPDSHPPMVWSPPSRTSSGQAPSLLPLFMHTLFPAGLLLYPTLCEWGHNTKAARTLSCFLLTAKKHVNLVRRSSTKPTPGKATPTHVTQSSAPTWLLYTTYFPVYYTLL